jgi:hypothetical protein
MAEALRQAVPGVVAGTLRDRITSARRRAAPLVPETAKGRQDIPSAGLLPSSQCSNVATEF